MKKYGFRKKLAVIGLVLALAVTGAGVYAPVNVQAKSKTTSTSLLNKRTVTAYPGMASVKLSIKGGKTARWVSSSPEKVSVDENGNLTFHAQGNVTVKAIVGTKTYKCLVSVCSKKAYNAVKQAYVYYNRKNMHYSQGSRMSKNSADCSSFCGRCYLSQGLTMGGSKSWCNTAAGMAKWATTKHKVVSNGKPTISSLTLLPGDLVFYRKGSNGRYKNIYHVEIFVGYAYKGNKLVGYTMSSITGHYPSILKRDYSSRRKRVAEVSRPAN